MLENLFSTENNYRGNKKIIVAFFIACIIAGCLIMSYWLHDAREHDKENLNIEFAGSIERVEYDLEQYPTITIGNMNYYIGAGYHTDHQIEVGDSIIKKRGSDVYKLMKRRSNKAIEFKISQGRF